MPVGLCVCGWRESRSKKNVDQKKNESGVCMPVGCCVYGWREREREEVWKYR